MFGMTHRKKALASAARSARIEGLESRRLLDASPLFNEGTVRHDGAVWSIDANGQNLIQLPSGATSYMPFGGSLYFKTVNVLWKTDGTAAGTVAVVGTNDRHPSVVWAGLFDGHLYYAAQTYSSAIGEEYGYLYRMDSTGKTETVQGIYGSLSPRISGGQLYVSENHYAPYSLKVYSVQGLTSTLLPGTSVPESDPVPLAPDSLTVGGKTFYGFDDGSHGNELWVDDGADAHLITDLFPGGRDSSPRYFGSINGRIIFSSVVPAPVGSATIDGGVLYIGGTNNPESIVVHSENGVTTVEESISSGVRVAAFNDADFSAIYVLGRNGNDLIDLSGAAHPASIYGGDGNDTLIGGAGNDSFDGGAGNDTLDYTGITESLDADQYRHITIGSALDSYVNMETLLCGSGDDHVSITSFLNGGVDSNAIRYIDGGAGNDHLNFSDYTSGLSGTPATVHGGDGDDTLSVNHGSGLNAVVAEYYFGDAGNDTFKMQRSYAFRDFNGGDGIDSVDYIDFSIAGAMRITLDDQPGDGPRGYDNVHSDVEVVYGSPWNDTIIGNDSDETLYGGSGSDSLVGNGGNDSLVGYSGQDTLDGGDGADTLDGGDGGDSIISDLGDTVVDLPVRLDGSQLVVDGTNEPDVILMRLKPGNSSVIQAIVNDTTFEFALSQVTGISINGYSGDDVISVDTQITLAARLYGFEGNDRLTGGGAADSLIGGSGTDTLIGNGGLDHFEDGEAIYQQGPEGTQTSLVGGVLRVYATAGNDVIRVRRSSTYYDILEVWINGGVVEYSTPDTQQILIDGLAGGDRIELDSGMVLDSKIYGSAGNDTILGGAGSDRIYAGDGNDWIGGFGGNDILYGEAGNDRIFGGEGRDYIVGGAGNDVMRGEGDQDRIFAKVGEDDFRGNSGDILTLLA